MQLIIIKLIIIFAHCSEIEALDIYDTNINLKIRNNVSSY